MANLEKPNKLAFLAKMSPAGRAGTVVGGLFVLVMTAAAVLAPKGQVAGGVKPSETNLSIPQTTDTSNEKLAAAQLATQKSLQGNSESIDVLKADNQKLREAAMKPPITDVAMQVQLDKLTGELADLKAQQTDVLSKQLPPPLPDKFPPTLVDVPLPIPVEEANKIRVIGGGAPSAKKTEKIVPPAPKAYLPAGAFFEAVLLNGMDAPTNAVAVKNPVPALARIKTNAILPNQFRHDIKECFVLMAGYGSLGSERAVMRLESLSCTAEDGRVMESKLDGYVVGEDGRVGMRGRLVSKQGQLIAQSLAAGVLGGFGTALTPTATPGLNLNAGTSFSLPAPGALAGTAVGKGFSDAATTVSKFYLEMASQMTPIIEVDAGRKITLILTKGVELK